MSVLFESVNTVAFHQEWWKSALIANQHVLI